MHYDWLGQELFTDISDLQERADKWLWTYNILRPNMDIGGITPAQKLKQLNKISTGNFIKAEGIIANDQHRDVSMDTKQKQQSTLGRLKQ